MTHYPSMRGLFASAWEVDTAKILSSMFPQDYIGVYVDVGAGFPECWSNSFPFREKGWKIIAIEPQPQMCEAFRKRGYDVLEFACAEVNLGTVGFEVFNDRAGMGGMSYSTFKIVDTTFPDGDVTHIYVQAYTLDMLLRRFYPEVDHIDILDIDVERSELRVLQGFDIDKYNPTVMVIENASEANGWVNPDEEKLHEYYDEKGYQIIGCAAWNEFVARRDTKLARRAEAMMNFMTGFQEPEQESIMQWAIWDNFLTYARVWGGMENDPHDHCDALYDIPYVRAGLEMYQSLVPEDAKNILEVGCAQGYILNHVGGPNTRRVGIDFNADRVRIGMEKYPDTKFIIGDIRHAILEHNGALDEAFDYALLPGILEHMRFQEARDLINRAIDACMVGGKVIFDLPWWSGNPADFNEGIHRNPSHAWVCTPYRWNWLFRGIDAQQLRLEGVPFYTMGIIDKQPTKVEKMNPILVGCWGKIGDIIHAMPMAQKLYRHTGLPIHVAYSPEFEAVSSALCLLEGIEACTGRQLDYESDNLGVGHEGWTTVVNASHGHGSRVDPVKGQNIFLWWAQYHGIDFAAAFARTKLEGRDRYLKFKPEVYSKKTNDVVFLSNCGDQAARGVPAEWLDPLADMARIMGGNPVECSIGDICTGQDRRGMPIGDVIKTIASAQMLISIDTMASAIIAQSLDVPVLRIYTPSTRPHMTGVTDPTWPKSRHVEVAMPTAQADAIHYIINLWENYCGPN